MKTFLFIIIISPLFSLGQKHNVKVELFTGDCRVKEPIRMSFSDTIRFYQNGNLYRQVIPIDNHRGPIELEDFTSGTYEVTYKNLYGQPTARNVIIPDKRRYELILCPDELDSYPLNSLATLHNGDTIKIHFSTKGCFHSEKAILCLTKRKDVIEATLSYSGKTKVRRLNDNQLEAFNRFENELAALKDGGYCTTTDTYTFVSTITTFDKFDGWCNWNGFYILCKALFGKFN